MSRLTFFLQIKYNKNYTICLSHKCLAFYIYIWRLAKKFWFQFRKVSSKNFLWASRLWVGRRKDPILSYITKNDEKNNPGTNGLMFVISYLQTEKNCVMKTIIYKTISRKFFALFIVYQNNINLFFTSNRMTILSVWNPCCSSCGSRKVVLRVGSECDAFLTGRSYSWEK